MTTQRFKWRLPIPALAALLAACLAWGCSSPSERAFEAAEQALRQGNQDQAEELLNRALNAGDLSDPLKAGALHYLAVIHLQRDEFAQAEAAAGRSLEQSLRRAETYLVRGMARLALDKTDAALEDFDTALIIEPGNPAAMAYRGQVRLERGDAAGAEADMTQVVESGRADAGLRARALFLRGEARAAQGRTDEALADLDQAAKVSPDRNLALAAAMRSAEMHAKAGDEKAADQALGRVVSQRPDLPDGWRRRGLMRYVAGRYAPAARDLEQALQLDPDHAPTLNQLAWLLATAPEAEVRDGGRAVTLAQRAVDLTRTGNAMFIDTLAAALAEAGRFSEAVTAQETALMVLGQTGPPDLEPEFRQRLELFRSRRAYHAAPEG